MSKYASYTKDQLEEHFSNYLIDSWSYSKVSCFSRNEKCFEMLYVYGEKERRSISSVAGNAYHEALKAYFEGFGEDGAAVNSVDLTAVAYSYLEDIPANAWKLTDKFPTVEQAQAEATRLVNAALANFLAESSIYTDNLSRVLSVEDKSEAWVAVNGVDIPLPLHFIIDLVIETKDGKAVIVDHKTKSAYTSEAEVALTHGQQAISYVLGYEELHKDCVIDEVWFVENKFSTNRDKSPQLRKHVITMGADDRAFFEYNLYLPLRRMCEAVSDPDYIFTTNNYDNLADLPALYEFSTRTMIAEVDDFKGIAEGKRDLIAKRQRKIKDSGIAMISPRVITEFRKNAASFITFDYSHSNMTNNEKIEHAFRTFGKQVQVAREVEGYSCNTYLCQVAAGTKLSDLKAYTLDIASALDVPSVRIAGELVVYEGKSYLAIEVNKKREDTLVWDASYLDGLALPVGLDNFGKPVVWNLDNHSTPHMLVCGATGSGKSVMIRSTIAYAVQAGLDDIIILDPKYEYEDLAGEGVKVYNDIREIEDCMAALVEDMQYRVANREKRHTMVIFDEFADAVQQSRKGKQLEPDERSLMDNLQMLLQKGRSSGFRILAATQRADVKTIPGTLKVNFPVACCFRVPKAIDSKVVLDEAGAETLIGGGDGLIKSPEYLDRVVRFQGFYKQ